MYVQIGRYRWGEDGSQTAGVGDQGKKGARGGTAKPRGRVDGGRADAKGTWRCLLWMTGGWRSALGTTVMHPPSKHVSTFLQPVVGSTAKCQKPAFGGWGWDVHPTGRTPRAEATCNGRWKGAPKREQGVDHSAQGGEGCNPLTDHTLTGRTTTCKQLLEGVRKEPEA